MWNLLVPVAGEGAWPVASVASHCCAQLLSRFPAVLSKGVHQSRSMLCGQQGLSPKQIPFSFSWLDDPLNSFLYLYCHGLDFVFKLISSVNDHTKFEKPTCYNSLLFLLFSLWHSLQVQITGSFCVATSSSVAYCLASKQLVPVFSSVAACLTPVLLEIIMEPGKIKNW